MKEGAWTVYFLYDAFDRLIAEYTLPESQSVFSSVREYVWANGLLAGLVDHQYTVVEEPCGVQCEQEGESSPLGLIYFAIPISYAFLSMRWRRIGRRGKIGWSLGTAAAVLAAGGILFYAERALAAIPVESTVEETVAHYWVHTDHLGTPIAMTGEAGQVVWKAWHDPFGRTVLLDEDPDADGAPVTLNVRFPGQYFDAETGLHYNWHRYYDPEIGRYLQADIYNLVEHPRHTGSFIDLSYQYSNNSPLQVSDISGRDTTFWGSLLGGAAGWFYAGAPLTAGGLASALGPIGFGTAAGGFLIWGGNALFRNWLASPFNTACISRRNLANSEWNNYCASSSRHGMSLCYEKVICDSSSPREHIGRRCSSWCGAYVDSISSLTGEPR